MSRTGELARGRGWMKRVACSVISAAAVLLSAAPVGASLGRAQDVKACDLQAFHSGYGRSPDCRPDFPGFTANHKETVVQEA